MLEKKCSKCKETKPASEFHKDNSKKDGLYYCCKKCNQKNHLSKNYDVSVTEKKCYTCKKTLPANSFTIKRASTDGLHSYCKKCNRKRGRKHYHKVAKHCNYEVSVIQKTCSKCQNTKPEHEFNRNRRMRDGLDTYCKSCRAEYSKAYYQTKTGQNNVIKAVRKYHKTPKGRKNLHENTRIRNNTKLKKYMKFHIGIRKSGMIWQFYYAQDGKCFTCGKKLKTSGSQYDPDFWNTSMIQAFADGGPLEIENIQLDCFDCNKYKRGIRKI